jgi:hypothetical protein
MPCAENLNPFLKGLEGFLLHVEFQFRGGQAMYPVHEQGYIFDCD